MFDDDDDEECWGKYYLWEFEHHGHCGFPREIRLRIGQSVPVTATVVDQKGNPEPSSTVSWNSSVPSIAIVQNNGFLVGTNNTISTSIITAIADGRTIITCTVDGTVIHKIYVKVHTVTKIDIKVGKPFPL